MEIKKIDKKKFDAYVLTSRSPKLELIGKEVDWYSNTDESILGLVLFDLTDKDYNGIILGKDEIGRYRAFNIITSLETIDEVVSWLDTTITSYDKQGKKIFPQGDPSKVYKLFDPITPSEKQHPYFKHLLNSDSFYPARMIINQIMPYFTDIDGNFIEQFQTTGFDSRVWELYLYSYFIESDFDFDRRHERPDFILEKYGEEIAVEAVIVGRKESFVIEENTTIPKSSIPEIKDMDEMAIRFGSPLFTKLNKKYWELEHVTGRPLIIAIADFHEDFSMTWSANTLINYLFGYDYKYIKKDNGEIEVIPVKIIEHTHENKTIPSGYFDLPDAENISGILFTSTGTINKFNRMGIQIGHKKENIKVFRYATTFNHELNATTPNIEFYEVNEDCTETWSEGLNLYHNPNALNPINPDLFPGVAHHFRLEDGTCKSYIPENHTYSSININMNILEDTK